MSSQFIVKEVVDRGEWTDFLNTSSYWAFHQSYEWGEFLTEVGKEVKRFGVYDGDQLISIFQVVFESSRFGKIGYIPRGPVLNWDDVSLPIEKVVSTIISHLKNIDGVMAIRVDPQVLNTKFEVYSLLKSLKFHEAVGFWLPERTWLLDLGDRTEEQILSGMRKNTRYYIKRAQKMGYKVERTEKKEDFEEFLNILYALSNRKGFVALPKEYLRKQFEKMILEEKKFRMYVIRENGKMITGAVIALYPQEGDYLHGASFEVRDTQTPYLLQWGMIQDALKEGVKKYNFWGVVSDKNYHPGHHGYGYSLFKRGFGGRLEEYIRTQDYIVSYPKYALFALQELFRKLMYKNN